MPYFSQHLMPARKKARGEDPPHWTRRLSRMVGSSEVTLSPLNFIYIYTHNYTINVPHSFSFMTSPPLFLFRAQIPSYFDTHCNIRGVSFLTVHEQLIDFTETKSKMRPKKKKKKIHQAL